jgi:hypothetical protein
VDLGARQIELVGEHRHGRRGNESELGLDSVEDFDERAGTRTVGGDDAEHGCALSWGKGLLHVGRQR